MSELELVYNKKAVGVKLELVYNKEAVKWCQS
jgi:hypothetical protein